MRTLLLAAVLAAAIQPMTYATPPQGQGGPLSKEQAIAAVDAARSRCPQQLASLKMTPLEFASIWLVVPYGSERIGPVRNPDIIGVRGVLSEKRVYWQSVDAALVRAIVAYAPKLGDSSTTLEEGRAAIQDYIRMTWAARASGHILDDIAADDESLDRRAATASRGNQELLDRKQRLLTALCVAKPD